MQRSQGVTAARLEDAARLDTSEARPAFVVESVHGAAIKLSHSSLELLRAVDAGLSFAEIATLVSSNAQTEVTADEIEAAYWRLRRDIEAIDERAKAHDQLPSGFWFQATIIPARPTARLAQAGAALFHLPALLGLAAALAIAAIALAQAGIDLRAADPALPLGYLLFLVSLIVHEIGHASACARFGEIPSVIGFTLYLVYPAFYSDVSSAWRLTRWQRVVVDLGGNYFQLLLAGVLGLLYLQMHWQALRVALVLIVLSCVFSLNPVFKLDGYWIVADALGVTNLGRAATRVALHFVRRLSGRDAEALPWPGPIIRALLLYSAMSFLVWAAFLWRLVPLVWRSIAGLRGNWARVAGMLAGKIPATLSGILSLVMYAFFLAGVALLILRLLRQTHRGLLAAAKRRASHAARP